MGLDIQSKEIIDKISDELKVQPAMSIPRELMDKIQLVYGVNPVKNIKVAGNTLSNGTSATIFTTSTTKRTFLVGASISVSKDVVSNSLLTRILAQPIGLAPTSFLILRTEPVTVAQGLVTNISFPIDGIELEKGSDVNLTNSSGTASIDSSAIVFFYETDPQ